MDIAIDSYCCTLAEHVVSYYGVIRDIYTEARRDSMLKYNLDESHRKLDSLSAKTPHHFIIPITHQPSSIVCQPSKYGLVTRVLSLLSTRRFVVGASIFCALETAVRAGILRDDDGGDG